MPKDVSPLLLVTFPYSNVMTRCAEAPMAKGYDLDIEPDDIDVSDTVTVLWEIA